MGSIAELRGSAPRGRLPTYNRARNYQNEVRRSAIGASPKLQLPNNEQLNEMYDEFETVMDVKNEAFTPKSDKRAARATLVMAVAVLAIAVFATIAAAHGGAALGIMAALAGTAYLLSIGIGVLGAYLNSKANDREREQEAVREIHKAAGRHFGTETLHKFDREIELAAVPPAAQKGRRGQPAANANAAARQPSAPPQILADGMSREESETIGY
jgi:hypothetical protein